MTPAAHLGVCARSPHEGATFPGGAHMKALSTCEPSRLSRTSSFLPLLASALLAGALACTQSAPPQDGETRSTSSSEWRITQALGGGIQFIQLSYSTPQSPVSTQSVKYVAAQTAGNLNVVV